jgi:hypothetical protein
MTHPSYPVAVLLPRENRAVAPKAAIDKERVTAKFKELVASGGSASKCSVGRGK